MAITSDVDINQSLMAMNGKPIQQLNSFVILMVMTGCLADQMDGIVDYLRIMIYMMKNLCKNRKFLNTTGASLISTIWLKQLELYYKL